MLVTVGLSGGVVSLMKSEGPAALDHVVPSVSATVQDYAWPSVTGRSTLTEVPGTPMPAESIGASTVPVCGAADGHRCRRTVTR